MRLKLISCELFQREVRAIAARSSNRIEIEFLPKSLHQLTLQEVHRGLQHLIRGIHRSHFHAILLVSGTCQHSLAGLQARSVPLVLPRAKDCLSLLLDRPQKDLSVLQLLVDGYWSYDDFLVVPVGWRIVVNAGEIAAEEVNP